MSEINPKMLESPKWRVSNLYSIKQEGTGKIIPFRPKPEQQAILDAIDIGHRKIFVPKSRRLGISTVTELIGADRCFFQAGFETTLVDRKGDEATKKLNNMVKNAYLTLPDAFKETLRVTKSNDTQFSVCGPEGQESHFYAGTQFRGGDCGLMHISELGWIQWWDPKRAEEIVTGSMPAARQAIQIIESTWKGGKHGEAWNIIKPALNIPDDMRTLRDWLVLFFPWFGDPVCAWEGNIDQITPACRDYLEEEGERLDYTFSPQQMLWYFKEAWGLGNRRFQEYPTTLEECFHSVVDGAIYEWEMNRLVSERRVSRFQLEKGVPVVASFDLGYNDLMPCCLIQRIGHEHRVFDYHCAYKEQVRYYIDWLRTWMATNKVAHVVIRLPHDGASAGRLLGKTVAQKFREGGFDDVQVVPRSPRVWTGIDTVRDIMPNVYLHADNCDREIEHNGKVLPNLLQSLTSYHQKETTDGHIVKSEPVHDDYSHGADSLRTYAEGYARGMIATPAGRGDYDSEVYGHHEEQSVMSSEWDGVL